MKVVNQKGKQMSASSQLRSFVRAVRGIAVRARKVVADPAPRKDGLSRIGKSAKNVTAGPVTT